MNIDPSQGLVNIIVISDSAGETATKTAQACMAQFPTVEFCLFRRTFINSSELLQQALQEAKNTNALILHTLVDEKLLQECQKFCSQHQMQAFDLLNPIISALQKRANTFPTREAGALHHLDENYFNRIRAMEFAVKYDDGKDPKGFLKADVVLLGVSRTSKTPLSLFLANKNLKVANLPLLPKASIPAEIFQVDPKKIVGLTNDPEILNGIRKERMKSYGLDPNTAYSDLDKIKEELAFARKLYDKLHCVVIDVSQLSIEETAALIIQKLGLEDRAYTLGQK